ncbi:MAG: RluA family pseudouridine synthase [Anaerolineales bacterium]|nr:RluA family pseudouridine synthase [Anaerolineales bacterium]MCW5838311.1 RluA family pseudouridine synthase [Anaerolineales bacterium]
MTEPAAEHIHHLDVPDGPQRLDKFLVAALPQYSRARVQALIKAGHVLVNNKPASKAGQSLEGGERVEVQVPPAAPSELQPQAIPLDVVFENDDVLIVNKPAGMVVHPAAGHRSHTLINAALAHAPEIEGVGGELRPGLVHRLDKDTSGLIALAKNDAAQQALQAQFQQRSAQKSYLALVDGQPATPQGRIEAPIGRDPRERKRMAVMRPGRGREAVSEYRTLESFPEHTLLEVDIHSGRTHQIRVHLAFIHCPVVADTVYGRRKPSLPLKRQFLHAARLGLVLPGETQPRTFSAPLPADLEHALNNLRARG